MVDEKERMERQLRLNSLSDNFSELGKFLWLARCSVISDPDLEIEVRTNIRGVHSLCHKTVQTLSKFERNSFDALGLLRTAYFYLKDGHKTLASNILKELQVMSVEMKDEAHKLSKNCESRSMIIMDLGNKIVSSKQSHNESKKEQLREKAQQINKDIKDDQYEEQEVQSDLQSNHSHKGEACMILTKTNESNEKKNASGIDIKIEHTFERKALSQILEVRQQFIKPWDSEEIQKYEVAVGGLQKALDSLNKIEFIMRDVKEFWKEIGEVCESIMSSSMKVQVKELAEGIFHDNTFWVEALLFKVKWTALGDICKTTIKIVNCTLVEVGRYMYENLNEERTHEIIKVMIHNYMAHVV